MTEQNGNSANTTTMRNTKQKLFAVIGKGKYVNVAGHLKNIKPH